MNVPANTLHLIDQGTGPTVVMVHGTPSSTYEFRHLIDALADHRCVAMDHLGFGQSPKPEDGDYRIAAHQRRFAHTMDKANVRDAVFLLHDFGTAIALPWMLANPDRVRGVVLCNTFLWPIEGALRWLLAFYATGLGRWLYRTGNLSAKYLLPWAWGSLRPLTAELHREYLKPFPTAKDRHATAALPGELIGTVLVDLCAQAHLLNQWPVRAVWGMADPMVGARELTRWRGLLPNMQVEEVAKAGHFVSDEAPEPVLRALRSLTAEP